MRVNIKQHRSREKIFLCSFRSPLLSDFVGSSDTYKYQCVNIVTVVTAKEIQQRKCVKATILLPLGGRLDKSLYEIFYDGMN